jgi:HPt (histidine-containing phosphotransfer) domain-containing protein
MSVTPPVTTAPVDVSVLAALLGHDRAVLSEVLQAFLASVLPSAAALRQAVGAAEAREAAAWAHKMKSGARAIGASHLGTLCADMEAAAAAGRADLLTGLLPAFEAELQAVRDFIDTSWS